MTADHSPFARGSAGDGRPAARAFMTRADHFDVEFRVEDLPSTVTAIIMACGDHVGEDDVWAMPVSTRIAELLTIVQRTLDVQVLEATTRCACGEWTTFELPIAALVRMSGHPDDVLTAGEQLRFRRPRGRDQQRWRAAGVVPGVEAFATMVRDLAVDRIDAPLTAEAIERIGEAFEEFDPLPALRVELACAHCGRQQRAAVDLQELCLLELLRVREQRLLDVHVLARAYGWSEESIVALSAARRQRYLRLIEDGR